MKYFWLILSVCFLESACKKTDKKITSTTDLQVSIINDGASVTFVGRIQNVAISGIKQVGFIWGKSANPLANDNSSFNYYTTPSENFQHNISAGFKKDSLYYLKSYFLDNSNIYHYSNAISFTSSGTKPITINVDKQYTWDDEAEISLDTLSEKAIVNININLNETLSIHPDKIIGNKLYFKVPESLAIKYNSLIVSIFGQKTNAALLTLISPQLTEDQHNLLNGSTLTLTGKYFNPQLNLNKVSVGSTQLNVTSGTTNQLTVQESNVAMSFSAPLTIQTGTNLTVTTNDNYNVYKYIKPKTPFPGVPRTVPVVLSINNKIYCGLGLTAGGGLSDWWQYDPNTDVWTRLADCPATAYGVNSFVIDNKAYVGNGVVGGLLSSAFYSFNPQTNTWSAKAAVPVTNFLSAPAVINSDKYAYLVSGFSRNPGISNVPVNDVWKYDPVANKWRKIADFPGVPREGSMYFNLGVNGYVLGGAVAGLQSESKDCWAFNFNTETWRQVASIPQDAGSNNGFTFTANGKGYTGGGIVDNVLTVSPFIYEYDPTSDVWVKKEKILDGVLYNAGGASVNNTGYILCGYKHYSPSVADGSNYFLEFTP